MLLKVSGYWLVRLLLCALAAVSPVAAQTPIGWLRYAIPPDPPRYHGLPHAVMLLGSGPGPAAPEELAAADELDRGLGHMVAGTDVVLHRFDPRIDAIVLGTTEGLHRARIGRNLPGWTEKALPEEGFRIVHLRRGMREWYILQGGSPRAELWAAFRFAALVAEDQQLPDELTDAPSLPLRALDLQGSADLLPLMEDSATHGGLLRLMASVGLNGLVIESERAQAIRIANAARPFGLRVWVRPNGATPDAIADLAAGMPNFGGVVVTGGAHVSLEQLQATAQQANTLARVVRRFGGSVLLQDALGPPLQELSTSPQSSRANPSPQERATVLRNLLEPNVMLMGAGTPLPLSGLASPNFGLLPGASQVAAFDVLARQAGTLAYPAGAWSAALQTPERGTHGDTLLSALLAATGGHGGVVGRMSAADAQQMLKQPLLPANLYALGRLLWSPALPVAAVTDEWSRQTFGDDARVHGVATQILLGSTEAARNNSAPLGLPLLATGSGGPDPAGAARLFHGDTPLANASAAGVDRTGSGTDEVQIYPAQFAAILADPQRCPTPWLLLFHRLAYKARLRDGETVAQNFYNLHISSASQGANAADAWEGTRGLVDEPRFNAVNTYLARAAVHDEIWRDTANEWLQQTSGVPDTLGFVGNHAGRLSAQQMQLAGYTLNGAGSAACSVGQCMASTVFRGTANVYRVEIGYLDQRLGDAFELRVNGEPRAHWDSPATQAPAEPERFVVNGVRLEPGDTVAVHATAAATGSAVLDFVEISRDPRWN
ncbi:MAG: alpha-glucuronidase family glycosyl hydrolase [Janthinobacterium lividum]